MREGTLVDATIIATPSSAKTKDHARDPEMHQAKKGNQWRFGMKAHIGVDAESGRVHSVQATAANESDVALTYQLLHGQGRARARRRRLHRRGQASGDHPSPASG